MITDDGCIFHIDFGFILGTDAYPLIASDIKLNSGMLEVIGGFNSDRYNKYIQLCSQGVVILRKYFNMFFILLSLNKKFTEKHIENLLLLDSNQNKTMIILLKNLKMLLNDPIMLILVMFRIFYIIIVKKKLFKLLLVQWVN